MDKIYVGQNFDQRHLVKIPADYFSQADTLLKSQITVSPEDVEQDYYLLSFSIDELKEVIIKKADSRLPFSFVVVCSYSLFWYLFLGIFIGGFVCLTKKTLPDGSRRHAFSVKTRNQGKWMIISGIVLMAVCWIVLFRIMDGGSSTTVSI